MTEPFPKRCKPNYRRSESASASDGERQPVPALNRLSNPADGQGNLSYMRAQHGRHSARVATAETYGKDILQMQIENLLEGLGKARGKVLSMAEPTLRQLKSAIESIEDRPATSVKDALQALREEAQVEIPFRHPRSLQDIKYQLSYKRPLRVNMVGSFAINTALVKKKQPATIDMALVMPANLFQEKDYLNYRYFLKRAYYIACVAAGLAQNASLSLSLSFRTHNGNALLPVIIAAPLQDTSKIAFIVRIMAVAPPGLFPLVKTYPDENCIRSQEAEPRNGKRLASTPIYNGTLRAEACAEEYLMLFLRTSKSVESFPPACVLMAVWLAQRGLGSSHEEGGFGAFESTALIALMLQSGGPEGRPKLSKSYNSFQLFKATLQFVANRDLIKDPIYLGDAAAESRPLQHAHKPLIWDGLRGLNLLYKTSPWSYRRLRHQASLTLEALKSVTVDDFHLLFIAKVNNTTRQYDDLFLVDTAQKALQRDPNEGLSDALNIAQTLHTILERALGSRARLIDPVLQKQVSWKLHEPPCYASLEPIIIGLVLNIDHIRRTVDRGPAAEEQKAATMFRQFWGSKSELRRFQDGSILESVIWEGGKDAPAVHRQVIEYSLARHSNRAAVFIGTDLYAIDEAPDYNAEALDELNKIRQAFDELQNVVRGLDQLPLHLRSFIPASIQLANSDRSSGLKGSVDVILQLEGSARWPEDIIAIQKTKIAFLLKLGQLLAISQPVYFCRPVIENTKQPLANNACLRVDLPRSGFRFNVRIHHEREDSLLSDKLHHTTSGAERESIADALSIYQRMFVRSPAHTQALQRLSIRFPFLAPTIVLLRTWCSAHLLIPHLASELLDLLVAQVFTQAFPYDVPASVRTAFLRVLDFIARWDWRHEPLIVDLDRDLTLDQVNEARTRLQALRKVDPAMNRVSIYAASSVNMDGTTWTQNKPTKAVASRLTALAQAATRHLALENASSSLLPAFSTGLADYDFVLHMSPRFIALHEYRKNTSTYKNLHKTSYHVIQPSPLELLRSFIDELRYAYANVMILFHDWAERPVVAGLWTPACTPRDIKANLDYSMAPMKGQYAANNEEHDHHLLVANREGILSDIARLGADLIERIEVRS